MLCPLSSLHPRLYYLMTGLTVSIRCLFTLPERLLSVTAATPAHRFNGINIPPLLRGEAAAAFQPKGGRAAAVEKGIPVKPVKNNPSA